MPEFDNVIQTREPLDVVANLVAGTDSIATLSVSAIRSRRSRPVLAERSVHPGSPVEFRLDPAKALALRFDYSIQGRADSQFHFNTTLVQSGRRLAVREFAGRINEFGLGGHQQLELTSDGAERLTGFVEQRFSHAGADGLNSSLNFLWTRSSYSRRLGSAGPGAAPQSLSEESDAREYVVWFATNRTPIFQSERIADFGPNRSDLVRFGRCRVTIPKSHEIGSLGSSWWTRIRKGDDRIHLRETTVLSEPEYWKELSAKLSAALESERDAVVFIHGYNVSFKYAARRAAQLGVDLGISGHMSFFSWPSLGRRLTYFADEAAIEASEGQITHYLTGVAEKSAPGKVHVIAHSMGNRALLRALTRITSVASSLSGVKFSQLIVAAPDVDAGVFKALSGAYALASERTTMYVCRADRALGLSRFVHQYDRAGFSPPVTVVPGVDTITVDDIDLTALGHGYVAETREVLMDIHTLLRHGARPQDRFGLRRVDADVGAYWSMAR